MSMSLSTNVRTTTLGQVWACLEAANRDALGLGVRGPAWDLIRADLLDVQRYLERLDPCVVDPRSRADLPGGTVWELVASAAALLDGIEPSWYDEAILALRVRVRRLETLLAPS